MICWVALTLCSATAPFSSTALCQLKLRQIYQNIQITAIAVKNMLENSNIFPWNCNVLNWNQNKQKFSEIFDDFEVRQNILRIVSNIEEKLKW